MSLLRRSARLEALDDLFARADILTTANERFTEGLPKDVLAEAQEINAAWLESRLAKKLGEQAVAPEMSLPLILSQVPRSPN